MAMVRRSSRNREKVARFSPIEPKSKALKNKNDSNGKHKGKTTTKKAINSTRNRTCKIPIKAVNVTCSPKKHRIKRDLVLGLVRLDNQSQNKIVVKLDVSNTLGRNPKKPNPRHVDLGMPTQDKEISRKLFTVLETKGKLMLQAHSTVNNNIPYVKYTSNGKACTAYPETILELSEGDYLCVRRRHKYQVTALPNLQNSTVSQDNLDKENQGVNKKLTKRTRSSTKVEDIDYDVAVTSKILSPKPSSPIKRVKFTKLPKGVEPFRPSHSWGVDSPDYDEPTTAQQALQDANRSEIALSSSSRGNDDEDPDDDDDDDDDGNVPRDMHVSLVNTYWKAINSSSPHIGTESFHTLLDDGKLPTSRLCGDLVNLLTFGPQTGGHLFFDGNRLILASQLLQRISTEFPKELDERISDAVDKDHWKTILDKLLEEPAYKENLHNSLRLQVISLQVLDLLLKSSTSIRQNIDAYGTKAACKVAANVLAHIWVKYGDAIWSSSHKSELQNVSLQLTDSMGKVMNWFLQHVNVREGAQILWNAMDSKILSCQQERKNGKQWEQNVKLNWVCSLDLKYTTKLVRSVGIQKVYDQILSK